MLIFRFMSLMIALIVVAACEESGGGSSSCLLPTTQAVGFSDEFLSDRLEMSTGSKAIVDVLNNNESYPSCSIITTIDPDSTITGVVQYQRIPLTNRGLDYANEILLPARGIVVQAVAVSGDQCTEDIVAVTLTNSQGEYGLVVPENQSVCVEARAQLYSDSRVGEASWNIQVVDNNRDGAAYYLTDFDIKGTPGEQGVRNLLAASGAEPYLDGYVGPRSAAPFAILDTLCEAIETLVNVDDDVQLPKLSVNWSVDNNTARGNLADGEIGGPFFRQLQTDDCVSDGASKIYEIYLLGDEDNNTDEYDSHVIAHEFGHFITDALSRFDAEGGAHYLDDKLDMRLAFEEGWADAFSAIALNNASWIVGDPSMYRDSLGDNQSRAFRFSVEYSNPFSAGWYRESTVYSTIYDIFDETNDGEIDTLSMGFAPIYKVLTSPEYINTDALLSLYSFFNHLKKQSGESVAIDTLLAEQNIEQVVDDYGSIEDIVNNDLNGREDVAVIYHQLEENIQTEVCSNNQFGQGNKLSIYQYLRFDAAIKKTYRFKVSPSGKTTGSGKPMLGIYQRGDKISGVTASQSNQTLSHELSLSGQYVVLLADFDNVESLSSHIGRRCFTITVE